MRHSLSTARPAVGTCPPQAGVSQRGAGERRACARAMDRGVAADGFDAAALMSNAEPLPLPPLVCGNGKQARRGALRERSGTATRSAAAAVAVHSQLAALRRAARPAVLALAAVGVLLGFNFMLTACVAPIPPPPPNPLPLAPPLRIAPVPALPSVGECGRSVGVKTVFLGLSSLCVRFRLRVARGPGRACVLHCGRR